MVKREEHRRKEKQGQRKPLEGEGLSSQRRPMKPHEKDIVTIGRA